MTFDEVAQKIGSTVGAAKQKHRAYQKLRLMLLDYSGAYPRCEDAKVQGNESHLK